MSGAVQELPHRSGTSDDADINARRDAASMMMSMSHLMAQSVAKNGTGYTEQPSSTQTVAQAPAITTSTATSHTSRGPYKKRTAIAAGLLSTTEHPSKHPHTTNVVNGAAVVSPGSSLVVPASVPNAPSLTAAPSPATTALAAAAAARGRTSTASRPTGPTGQSLTEEEKKAERRAANRRSAFQSRQRRKLLIEDLQRTVAALSKENTDLRKNSDELRGQLEAALSENHQLRSLVAQLAPVPSTMAPPQAQAPAPTATLMPQKQENGASATSDSSAQEPHQNKDGAEQNSQSLASRSSPDAIASSPSRSQRTATEVPLKPSPVPPSSPPTTVTHPTPSDAAAVFTNALSQAILAGSIPTVAHASASDHHNLMNAKLQLMAAQSRLTELENHAQQQQKQQQQQHAEHLQKLAQAAFAGLAQSPGASSQLNPADVQNFVYLQGLLTRNIGNVMNVPAAPPAAPPATAPSSTAACPSYYPNGTSNVVGGTSGADLSHFQNLLDLQQKQQRPHQVSVSSSSTMSTPNTDESTPSHSSSENQDRNDASKSKDKPPHQISIVQRDGNPPANSSTTSHAAPGIQLLLDSIHAGEKNETQEHHQESKE